MYDNCEITGTSCTNAVFTRMGRNPIAEAFLQADNGEDVAIGVPKCVECSGPRRNGYEFPLASVLSKKLRALQDGDLFPGGRIEASTFQLVTALEDQVQRARPARRRSMRVAGGTASFGRTQVERAREWQTGRCKHVLRNWHRQQRDNSYCFIWFGALNECR